MTMTVTPFLMFQGACAEAVAFYTSVFPDTKVMHVVHYGPNEGGVEGSVKSATFSVAGQIIRCSDSSVKHAFSFTPAFSLYVECDSDEQINRHAAALSKGGTVFMPMGEYGFGRRFTWLNDRFGVSWQLNLA